MLMNLIARRLLSFNGTRQISSTIFRNNSLPVKKKEYKPLSVEEYVEKKMNESPSKIPDGLRRIIVSIKHLIVKPLKIDPKTKSLLDKSATQLYFNCADNFSFMVLQEKLGLPDTVASWYKLTLLHVWMVLLRIHVSMDYYAYERFRTSLLTAMWYDIDSRLEVVSKEINQRLNKKEDIKKMHGLYVQTLFEYDEAFLKNDVDLAGALWRNLYTSKEIDPIYLCNAIMYMRSTVAFLDTLETGELLVSGISNWRQFQMKISSN